VEVIGKIILAIIMGIIITAPLNTAYGLTKSNRSYTLHNLEYNYGFGVGYDTGRGYGDKIYLKWN
jgi:hypothetical protein